MSRTSKRSSKQAADSGGDRSALARPGEFRDADWSEKIAIAKEAKQVGAELRKDKPATFATRHSTNWKTN